MNPPLALLLEDLAAALLARQWHVTAAESCTGGGIAQAFTSLPGSSQWFETGLVTYSNLSKQHLLGVSAELLAEQGAVSEAVVTAMALGALRVANAELAVAVSGIAGPDGGTAQKPVGSVWFAWACTTGAVTTTFQQFSGSRASVREQAVAQGIAGLVTMLKKIPV